MQKTQKLNKKANIFAKFIKILLQFEFINSAIRKKQHLLRIIIL